MARRACLVDGCTRAVKSRGWCGTHYERWRRNGDLELRIYVPLWDRFWPQVDAAGDCWIWTGTTHERGYGSARLDDGTRTPAHRAAWELLVGRVAGGLELDRLCRNPPCVNPDHMEPVTHAENMRRAPWTAVQFQRSKTHCPRKHEYVEANTYVNPKGSRVCRTCMTLNKLAYRARRKEARESVE